MDLWGGDLRAYSVVARQATFMSFCGEAIELCAESLLDRFVG
jgi:hypothetical protein